MKGYWVARCHITDGDEYSKYAALAGPIIESFGGIFLVRGGNQLEAVSYTHLTLPTKA